MAQQKNPPTSGTTAHYIVKGDDIVVTVTIPIRSICECAAPLTRELGGKLSTDEAFSAGLLLNLTHACDGVVAAMMKLLKKEGAF